MPSKRDKKCRLCPSMIDRQNTTGLCIKCFQAERKAAVPSARVRYDVERKQNRVELDDLKRKYDAAIALIDRQKRDLRNMGAFNDGINILKIEPTQSSKTSEAVPVLVASDWHIGEDVTAAQTNGLNVFNRAICDLRVPRFFKASLNLIKNHINPGVRIDQVVLALLGDFINNHLHEEASESNNLLPMHEVIRAEEYLASGIQFLLDNSPYSFLIPCKSGNHGRTTKKTRFATEDGHSLEFLMYRHLASYFYAKGETRVQFNINAGYHDYLDIYDQTIRLHHGHAINYGGGIGGIFIPAFKAISQWDKARRADLDVFGHFHQEKDGGKFLSNGSLVGYNSFAVSIKADYEPPKQQLFVIDKKRGRTCNWPILVGESGKK